MLNGDVNWHVSQSGDSSYKNKISKFLQSEFVRDLFPEHNSRSTNPNYQFGLVNRNNNCNYSIYWLIILSRADFSELI